MSGELTGGGLLLLPSARVATVTRASLMVCAMSDGAMGMGMGMGMGENESERQRS